MSQNMNYKMLKKALTREEFIYELTTMESVSENIRHELEDNSLLYILVPLAVLFGVFILSALVLFMARNRRRLVRMCKTRQELASHFNYLDDESDISLLDNDEIDVDPTECLLQGKLHINNDNHHHYHSNADSRVLFV